VHVNHGPFVFADAGKSLSITPPVNPDVKAGASVKSAKAQPFEFDTVFNPATTQAEVFEVQGFAWHCECLTLLRPFLMLLASLMYRLFGEMLTIDRLID
jgi:hypothetical protein